MGTHVFQHVTVSIGIKRNVLCQCHVVRAMDDVATLVRITYEILVDVRSVDILGKVKVEWITAKVASDKKGTSVKVAMG